jgi:hypothetical protein
MNKSTHFSGQPTFSQLINLIPKGTVRRCIKDAGSDRYYKKFDTWHHLISMLFTCYGRCHSLREVVSGMRALEGRLQSCGINYFPARSTFAEANLKRDSGVFEAIYFSLKKYWDTFSPDSRKTKKLYVIDSSTIKLFQEIFKGSGLSKNNGKRKGGLKMHMAVPEQHHLPSIMHITQAAYNDVTFGKNINLPMGSTVVMDRGYRDYTLYNNWSSQKIRWITRTHPNSYYVVKKNLRVSKRQGQSGVLEDSKIKLGHPAKKVPKVNCRLIKYVSPLTGKYFEFITNDFKAKPLTIARLYKKRWSIELLFKRLKQNMPLQYFLGDNQNAIRIQIWSALIADLLLQVVLKQIKRKWAFSNIVSLIRLHLFNYLNLFSFLENPEKCVISSPAVRENQLKLNLSG